MQVKLTLSGKECKMPLIHMLTEYRVTVTQTSNCERLCLCYLWKCFNFIKSALNRLPYEHQVINEL